MNPIISFNNVNFQYRTKSTPTLKNINLSINKGEKVLISEERSPVVSASRTRVGMMDIIDHIGEISGIDDAVYGNTDRGTAQKILSLAGIFWRQTGSLFPV